MSRFNTIKARASALWRPVREAARKLAPSRAVRWGLIYLPLFTAVTIFALKAFGAMDDLIAYALELAPKTMHVMAAVVMTYVVSTGLGWNLDNAERANYQRLLVAGNRNAYGAFLVLAGEFVAISLLLGLFLWALLVWQG